MTAKMTYREIEFEERLFTMYIQTPTGKCLNKLQALFSKVPNGNGMRTGFKPKDKALKTWKNLGALNLEKLFQNEVIQFDPEEGEEGPSPVQIGFECDLWGWNGSCYCEFGQVNADNKLNGLARVITGGYPSGEIIEGQFKNGEEHGWQRVIWSNGFGSTIQWRKRGNLHGYKKDIGDDGNTQEENFND